MLSLSGRLADSRERTDCARPGHRGRRVGWTDRHMRYAFRRGPGSAAGGGVVAVHQVHDELLEVPDQMLGAGEVAALIDDAGSQATLHRNRSGRRPMPTWRLNAISSCANVLRHAGREILLRKAPWSPLGRSATMSIDRLGKPGLMLMVMLGNIR